jgi:hypothetical protein
MLLLLINTYYSDVDYEIIRILKLIIFTFKLHTHAHTHTHNFVLDITLKLILKIQ